MIGEDVVFILQGPSVRLSDPAQFHRACEVSLSRFARVDAAKLRSYKVPGNQAVTSPSQSTTKDTGPPHKRTLSQAFSAEESISESHDHRARAECDSDALSSSTTCSRSHGHSGLIWRLPRMGAKYSRTLRANQNRPGPPSILDVPIDDPEVLREKQKAVNATEKRSVRKLGHQYCSNSLGVVNDIFYTFPLKLGRKQNRSELDLWGGTEYQLAVDTADCGFWFYELDFKRFETVEEQGISSSRDFVHQEWPEESKHSDHKVIPAGEISAIKEEGWGYYGDDGVVHVRRWEGSHDLQFYAPTWDWTTNKIVEDISRLFFARILADWANMKIVMQASDGNLGLAVPGWRAPWPKATPSNRVTIYDVFRTNGQAHVETPMQATLRLLFPDEVQETYYAGDNVRSFLYFGKGSPCGMLVNGEVLLPDYSPPLYIFPDEKEPAEFHFWKLQFLSMTLMEPVPMISESELNHETVDPAQWVAKRIEMPNSAASSDAQHTVPGISAILDSCSACTVLPEGVIKAIWAFWFGHSMESFNVDEHRIWHSDATRFARHDVIFEFMDYRGTIFNLRCSAQDFLTSPWSAEGENTRYALFESADALGDNRYILGMNFFWCALLKMNGTHRGTHPVPGIGAQPYVQFAPQRIVRDGRRIGTAWDLGLHKYLAPRQLAEVRDQPQIHADP